MRKIVITHPSEEIQEREIHFSHGATNQSFGGVGPESHWHKLDKFDYARLLTISRTLITTY